MEPSSHSQRSRWLLKEGDQRNYEQPRADYFVSGISYNSQGQMGQGPGQMSQGPGQMDTVQYPLTVTDGPDSDYVRCYWTADKFSMCEKTYGCCTDGCCPKDEWWMAGVYVLIAFVVAVAIIAVVAGVVCYKRGSIQKRKERAYYSTSGSALGSHRYGSEVGSHRSVNVGAPY